MKAYAIIIGTFAAMAMLAVALAPKEAKALSGPLSTLEAYTVSCGTTATTMLAPNGGGIAFRCYSGSSTPVYVGGSGVGTSGYAHCTDSANCDTSPVSIDARTGAAFCRVSSGTVTLKCLAGRP